MHRPQWRLSPPLFPFYFHDGRRMTLEVPFDKRVLHTNSMRPFFSPPRWNCKYLRPPRFSSPSFSNTTHFSWPPMTSRSSRNFFFFHTARGSTFFSAMPSETDQVQFRRTRFIPGVLFFLFYCSAPTPSFPRAAALFSHVNIPLQTGSTFPPSFSSPRFGRALWEDFLIDARLTPWLDLTYLVHDPSVLVSDGPSERSFLRVPFRARVEHFCFLPKTDTFYPPPCFFVSLFYSASFFPKPPNVSFASLFSNGTPSPLT